MSICCQKSLPETCKLRALELQPKLGKEREMSLCQNRFQYTSELKGVGGEKRMEETQRRDRLI